MYAYVCVSVHAYSAVIYYYPCHVPHRHTHRQTTVSSLICGLSITIFVCFHLHSNILVLFQISKYICVCTYVCVHMCICIDVSMFLVQLLALNFPCLSKVFSLYILNVGNYDIYRHTLACTYIHTCVCKVLYKYFI